MFKIGQSAAYKNTCYKKNKGIMKMTKKRSTILINRFVLESIRGLPNKIVKAEADHINRNKLDIAIADLLQTGNYSVDDIALLFSMPTISVNNIKLKIRWKDLLTDYDFSKVPSKKDSQ